MKVLVVCSYNAGRLPTFIEEQVFSLVEQGVEGEYFTVIGRGVWGYLRNLKKLKKRINRYKPDLIHAHYGLSGLLANFQRQVPVITTFHGSDINVRYIRVLSWLAMKLSAHSIFVSEKLARLANACKRFSVVPCGVDLKTFYPMNKVEARQIMGYEPFEKLILFSSSFDNRVKNPQLAIKATQRIKDCIKLIELKGYSRNQVNLLLNACDIALLTSFSEGSSNFIKEAMACNCPIVATDVGDVRDIFGDTMGTYICSSTVTDVARKLSLALAFDGRTEGRKEIRHLDIDLIAIRLIKIYEETLGRSNKNPIC